MSDTVPDTPHTSYIGSVICVARTLDAYGLDGSSELAEAGIDIDATPAFDARVPVGELHRAVIAQGGSKIDPLFGIKYAEFVNPATYHAFGVMLTSSTTLRAFCMRLQRYWAYINTGDRVEFDGHGRLRYQQIVLPELFEEPYENLLHESAWVATMLKLLRMVSTPKFSPQRITMAFAKPEGFTDQYDAYFRCPIEYDAQSTIIYFAEADLDLPLAGGNAELARHSESLVYNYLKTFIEMDVLNAARMALFELLPRGLFSLDILASSLDMGEQTLSADLKQAGTSYQQLLGDSRRELAEEYITRADLSINEIAYMLGFSDCSNFARSFRRWTGMSPTDFRENLQGL
ncbi:MAG: AraC family transcriptional regulator ligand-binding domain-containing protein [Halioglobus sp.]